MPQLPITKTLDDLYNACRNNGADMTTDELCDLDRRTNAELDRLWDGHDRELFTATVIRQQQLRLMIAYRTRRA